MTERVLNQEPIVARWVAPRNPHTASLTTAFLFAALAACIATSLHAQSPGSRRVQLETRLGGDSGQVISALPANMRRHLVFNGAVGGGPSYVTLDSGVVYRILVHEDLMFSTRLQYRKPPFTVPGNFLGPLGYPLLPSFTGEYRMDQLSPTATSSVQIYREDADAVEMACLQDPHMEGCAGRHHYRRGIIAGLLAIPAILVVDLLFHKR